MISRPYSNKLCWRVITHNDYIHSSFRFQYRLLTMTTFFEIAVHAFFFLEQFYKNNKARICPKIKDKLRTTEAQL